MVPGLVLRQCHTDLYELHCIRTLRRAEWSGRLSLLLEYKWNSACFIPLSKHQSLWQYVCGSWCYPYAQAHCLIIQKKKNSFKSSSAIISFFPVLSALRFCSKQVFWLLFLGAEGTHAFLMADVAISVMLNSRVCRRKPLLSLEECESWSFYFCIEVSIWEGLKSIKSILGHNNFVRFTFGSLYFLS